MKSIAAFAGGTDQRHTWTEAKEKGGERMIFSSIHAGDDLSKYPEAIARAIRYASTTDFSQMEDGRYPIDGDRMFVQLFHLTSKQLEETKPELHEKYVDVQYWLTGEELCGVAPADGVGAQVEAHEDRDLYFYDSVKNEGFIHPTAGCYAVFFPSDAHRPGVCVDRKPLAYSKVVVKVSMELL